MTLEKAKNNIINAEISIKNINSQLEIARKNEQDLQKEYYALQEKYMKAQSKRVALECDIRSLKSNIDFWKEDIKDELKEQVKKAFDIIIPELKEKVLHLTADDFKEQVKNDYAIYIDMSDKVKELLNPLFKIVAEEKVFERYGDTEFQDYYDNYKDFIDKEIENCQYIIDYQYEKDSFNGFFDIGLKFDYNDKEKINCNFFNNLSELFDLDISKVTYDNQEFMALMNDKILVDLGLEEKDEGMEK